MFIPIKTNDGAMTPFEYMEAAAGTYQVGQLLNVTGGKLAAIAADQATTPPYVCMQSGTVKAGEPLAVTRVGEKYIFETELATAATAVTVGTKIQVASGGLKAKYVTGASDAAVPGTFEVVSLDGTAAGSKVRGRFV